MTLPLQEPVWPERLGSGGAAWAVTGENTGSKGRNQKGPVGEKGIGSQEARPGQENRPFHTGGSCSQGPSTTSLLSPSPKTGPQPLTLGASEEEAGSNQASRRNSDTSDPEKLRTREESGAEDAEFHVTEDIYGGLTMFLDPVKLSWAGPGPVNSPHVGTPGAAGEKTVFPLTGRKREA